MHWGNDDNSAGVDVFLWPLHVVSMLLSTLQIIVHSNIQYGSRSDIGGVVICCKHNSCCCLLGYLAIMSVVEAIIAVNMRSQVLQLWCRSFFIDKNSKVGHKC